METADWIRLVLIVLGYIAERVQFFSGESRQLVRVLVQAVNEPQHGKTVVKDSPVKDHPLLNAMLDKTEPRKIGDLGDAPRVSKARKFGRFLVGLLPLVSRIPALKGKLF